MRKVREYSFYGSVQFCSLSTIVQFHHFQISIWSLEHVADEILFSSIFRRSLTRIWRQTPPEGFCHKSSFQVLHYKSYPEKDFVEECFFSSLMGPSLTTQVMVAQKVVFSKQGHFGKNLWWPRPLLAKVEVGCKESKRKGSWWFQIPGINHNHQRSRIMSEIHPFPYSSLLPPIPKDMWKPPGWPPPRPNPVETQFA